MLAVVGLLDCRLPVYLLSLLYRDLVGTMECSKYSVVCVGDRGIIHCVPISYSYHALLFRVIEVIFVKASHFN